MQRVARVVDEIVEALTAPALQPAPDLSHESIEGASVAGIELKSCGLPAQRFDFTNKALRFLFIRMIGKDHVNAATGKVDGSAAAEATAGAGDDGGFLIHDVSVSFPLIYSTSRRSGSKPFSHEFLALLRSEELFVAQGFDGIEAGSFDRRQHAADQTNKNQDDGGDQQMHGRDAEIDIAGFSILGHDAVNGNAADDPGDDVSDHDAEQSAGKGDGHGFRQELRKDVTPARTQSLFHADVPGALGDGN